MPDPVRWGILGTGNITRRFLAHAREADNARFVACGSRTFERATEFARRFGIERAHGTYDDLLADPGVDAVYICLPNGLHHEWTMRALAAGKHVLCEKPFSRRPAEVVEAFDVADAAGLVLMEGFMWRHTPQARRFAELLPEIGDLQAIRTTFSFVLDDPNDVRLRADLDGGSLMDVGCYCVSAARFVADAEPEWVTGRETVGPSGVDVRFGGVLELPGGIFATIECGFTSDHATLEAVGSEGSLLLVQPWHGRAPAIGLNGRNVPVEGRDPYLLEVENFSAAVLGETPALLGRGDALGQARTIAALYRSAEAGAAVRV